MILQLETATTNCSVSLSSEGETLVLKEDYGSKYSHAERLHVYIDEVVQKAGVDLAKLEAVSVSMGPGSYTGLRIGVSAAKGLCYALGIPLIAIPTLQSLAAQLKIENGLIIPMIDARRMEVYSAVFDVEYKEVRETRAEVLNQDSFIDYLNTSVVHFIGNGVKKASAIIKHENARFIRDRLPSADDMSKLSWDRFKEKRFENVAYFEPYYLKDFIALKPKS